MPVHAQLLVLGQPDQRLPFEHAGFIGGQVIQKITFEEEITAVDPFVLELRLLIELPDFVAVQLDLTEA